MMPDGWERDCRVPAAQGRIPLKTWGGSGHSPIPIVLFNDLPDTLGSWGDFPARLSQATGQMVVALDLPVIGHSELSAELLHFDSFIACGHDGGGVIATAAAARSGPACLGLITIRSRAWLSEPSSAVSTDKPLPKLRCPVLALHGEFGTIGHDRRSSAAGEAIRVASGRSEDEIISAIREFLALRVFPLPLH